jgi:hypothetical protein
MIYELRRQASRSWTAKTCACGARTPDLSTPGGDKNYPFDGESPVPFVDTYYTSGYTSRFLTIGVRAVRPRGRSSVGRALEWHSRGQGFDSPRLHQRPPVRSMTAGPSETAKGGSEFAGIAQLVEHNLAKVGVAGSSPVSRSLVSAPCYKPSGSPRGSPRAVRAVSSVG